MRLTFIKIACLLYECLILLALLMLVTLLFVALFGDATTYPKRGLLQLTLWLCIGVYFVWQWVRGGQTLAMKTWKLKISSQQGTAMPIKQGILRYLIATAFFGLSFLWAFIDRHHQYLHDRFAGTRIDKVD